MRERIPRVIKLLYPKRIWDVATWEKSLYLSFDDGPIPEITPWVLDQLKKYNARASFFCIGDNVRKHPDIFRMVVEQGHTVGNHTHNHLNGWRTSVATYLENVRQAQEVIEKELPQRTGLKNAIFRPPYGKIRNVQAKKLQQEGYSVVMWSIVSMDYDQRLSSEKVLQNVLKNAVPGSIIVFHDSIKAEKNLKAVLPQVLEHFQKQGYSFKALK
ncbi:polysaccharide deacetylase family protein [Salinimicrobium sp. MT39]|uniref:Polysaccharide deacetylase family protein n=1 Tax=Salinimicrobium profundisediminis TaxID=2994553 RepID=A0A9X3CWP5_9FLAO|nr:polysaccharide deacetylase family protein [Salinimicrobium profundisediminis]MCX2836799.1 polysaccharide deacetylase family protein [Salinimicrobium profundisediminis]